MTMYRTNKFTQSHSKATRPNGIGCCLLAAAICVGCIDNTIYDQAGKHPDREAISASTVSLRAGQSPDNVVRLTFTEGSGSATKDIFVRSSVPLEEKCTFELVTGTEDDVKAYSEKTGTDYELLPTAFYKFGNGKYIDMTAGETESAYHGLTVYARNLLGNVLEPGRYLLPVIGSSSGHDLSEDTVFIDIMVRASYTDPDGYPLCTDKNLFTVFYLNTSAFDPRLANDMVLISDNSNPEAPQYGMGNIVNLRSSSVDYDPATGKVSVIPSNDLRFVLDHYTERVLPVQESGRKVCLCIEGGGKGIGFCNFTDAQIADFTASVKRMVDTYGLDGINLWDRNSGYDKAKENGFSEMNTTSYPKLIRAIREALGNGRLLTVTDHEEPTAYFHDTDATEGIEVGKYIDYTWQGYYDNREPFQVIDPWNQGLETVSSLHPRRPFAGLDRSRYGCIHGTPRKYDSGLDNAQKWSKDGYYNGMIVFYDLRSNIQDQYEGVWQYPGTVISHIYNLNSTQNLDRLANENGTGTSKQYGKWQKDW